ncbi:MAG: ferredoxin [Bacilli bacterium]
MKNGKKVVVNEDNCIACGLCYSMAENLFQPNDMGLSKPIKEKIEKDDEELAFDCVNSCPTMAIEIIEI